jgi:kynurenine formamidase
MRLTFAALVFCLITAAVTVRVALAQVAAEHMKDLSLLVSPELPCVWPVGQMPHAVIPQRQIGPGAYRRDLILIDEHTGTQWDAPAHFVPPPDSGLPGAGPTGKITSDKVPVWQFCGEACVIDITKHCDDAPEGSSYLIRPDIVMAWEKANRPLKFGDVVLFKSGYSDKYYQPFPAGDRFVASALRKDTPGWPAPTPETMEYLAERGVMTLGLDGASMGPIPDLAAATHQAGGKRGMIWMECGTNLGSLPTTGAFYAILAPKHAGGSGSECRVIGVTEPKLAARLIASARKKQVADLSVTLNEEYPVTWPGYGAGDEASRYVGKVLNAFSKARGPYFSMTHMFDGQAGAHVVPPSFSLPPSDIDAGTYAEDVRNALADYEKKFGKRGTSGQSLEQIPLEALLGDAHVIDVRKLIGTTKESQWPASPAITLELVKQHEAQRPIKRGEVVIFHSGYSDEHFKPLPPSPDVDRLFAAPLQGKAEGWPAPTPEVIADLAEKGVRCLGTDGPTLGGVDRASAAQVYWLAATMGIYPVEYLTNVGAIADKEAFFIFAPVRIKGTAGGYGRAIVLY